jgi:hypothetical protein
VRSAKLGQAYAVSASRRRQDASHVPGCRCTLVAAPVTVIVCSSVRPHMMISKGLSRLFSKLQIARTAESVNLGCGSSKCVCDAPSKCLAITGPSFKTLSSFWMLRCLPSTLQSSSRLLLVKPALQPACKRHYIGRASQAQMPQMPVATMFSVQYAAPTCMVKAQGCQPCVSCQK